MELKKKKKIQIIVREKEETVGWICLGKGNVKEYSN